MLRKPLIWIRVRAVVINTLLHRLRIETVSLTVSILSPSGVFKSFLSMRLFNQQHNLNPFLIIISIWNEKD